MAIYDIDQNAYILDTDEIEFSFPNVDSHPYTIIGNTLDNIITGNAGDNLIDGGLGQDVMRGGLGDDTYIVDNVGDKVVEQANGGTDTVITSVDYSLGPNGNIEILQAAATVTHGLQLTGSLGDNTIIGGAGDDTIDGGAGADLMQGGKGNDTYLIDNLNDKVVESADGGSDTAVISVANYDLSKLANVEHIVFTGDAGTAQATVSNNGGTVADTVTGGSGSDVVKGLGSQNRLVGGLGSDKLIGTAGSDTFVFDTKLGKNNIDTITHFDVKHDTIELDHDIFTKIKVGKLSASAFAIGKAHDHNDRIILDAKKHLLLYDADGSGKAHAVAFAHLQDHLKLKAADFHIV